MSTQQTDEDGTAPYPHPSETPMDDQKGTVVVFLSAHEAEYWPLDNGSEKFYRGVYQKDSEPLENVGEMVDAAMQYVEHYEDQLGMKPLYVEMVCRRFGSPDVRVGHDEYDEKFGPDVFEEPVTPRTSLKFHPAVNSEWIKLGSINGLRD